MTVGAATQGRFGHVSQDAEDPRDKPVRSRRVAVIDERGALRTGDGAGSHHGPAAGAGAQLAAAFGTRSRMSTPPDLIVLGRWRCDVTDADADATDVPEQVESLACPVFDRRRDLWR